MHASRRYALVAATTVLALLVLVALLLGHEPACLQDITSPGRAPSGDTAERLAARLVTNASAFHAAIGREGTWEAVFTDAEVNAWLAIDLPRNHRSLLPSGVTSPRVRFRPRRVACGVRLGYGVLSCLAWADLEVELRGIGQLRITPATAGLGAIPLPADFALGKIARSIAALGLATDLRRIDGRLALSIAIPAGDGGKSRRLESIRIDEGEVVLTGATQAVGSDGRAGVDSSR